MTGGTGDYGARVSANDSARWDGTSWTEVPIASPGDTANVMAVSATSGTIFAVGNHSASGGPDQTLVETYC